MNYKDTKFMTAREKEKVVVNFSKFCDQMLQRGLYEDADEDGVPGLFRSFTKALYEHLHLHCGFIAHYNRSGFYAEYFRDLEDAMGFFERVAECSGAGGADYEDINSAMADIASKMLDALPRMQVAEAL